MTDQFNQRLREALKANDMEEAGRLCAENVSPAPLDPLTMIALAEHFSALVPKLKHRPKGSKLHTLKDRLRLGKEFRKRMEEVPEGERRDRKSDIAEDISRQDKKVFGVKQLEEYRAEYNKAIAMVLPVLSTVFGAEIAAEKCEKINTLRDMYVVIKYKDEEEETQQKKFFEDAELSEFFELDELLPKRPE